MHRCPPPSGPLLRALALATSLATALLGCDDELGEGTPGVTVTGEITYAGSRTFTNPLLVVMVLSAPDAALPYAVTRLPASPLPGPIPYELRFVPEGTWYVLAAIDEAATFSTDTASLGGYPDSCTLFFMPEGRSITVGDAGLESIDVTVYDQSAPDPCFFAATSARAATRDALALVEVTP